MADSTIVVSDANDVDRTLRTDEVATVHTPHHIVASSALPALASTSTLQNTINTNVLAGNVSLTALATTVGSGQLQVDLVDIAGASTASLQGTANGLLGTIDTDTGSIDAKITTCNTGAVVLAGGTAGIGALTAGTAAIGTVKLGAGTGAEIGKLAAGTAAIGSLTAGTAEIGTVKIGAGTGAAMGKLSANSGVDIGDVDVTSVTLPTGGIMGTVGHAGDSTAVTLRASATLKSGVTVKALSTNAASVFIGFGTNTTATTSGTTVTGGIELSAKESVFIEVDDINEVWINAAAAGVVTYVAT